MSFFFYYFSEKIRLDLSCEALARQTVIMKCQVLFSLAFHVTYLLCRSLHESPCLISSEKTIKKKKYFKMLLTAKHF